MLPGKAAMSHDEIFSAGRLNAVIQRCFGLARGECVNLLSIQGEIPDEDAAALMMRRYTMLSPELANETVYATGGFLAYKIGDAIEQGVAPTIRRAEFLNCVSFAVKSVMEFALMNYTFSNRRGDASMRDMMCLDEVAGWQMDIVGVGCEQQRAMARNKCTALVILDKAKDDDMIESQDLSGLENEISLRNKNVREEMSAKYGDGEAERCGKAVFDRCTDPEYCRTFLLSDKHMFPGVIEGIQYILSGRGRIGWHPHYAKMLDEARRKGKEEGHGRS